MARTPQDVTDAELNVLEFLWENGRSTIRQLVAALYPEGGPSKYATVQKLLERLEDAGCVGRDRSGPVHTFEAKIDRDELIGRRLQGIAEQLCGGSLAPLLTHLMRAERLSEADRRSLRDLIDQLDPPKSSKPRRPAR
jgi:BlaI family transcriptional regulator, penicillinase repressor